MKAVPGNPTDAPDWSHRVISLRMPKGWELEIRNRSAMVFVDGEKFQAYRSPICESLLAGLPKERYRLPKFAAKLLAHDLRKWTSVPILVSVSASAGIYRFKKTWLAFCADHRQRFFLVLRNNARTRKPLVFGEFSKFAEHLRGLVKKAEIMV